VIGRRRGQPEGDRRDGRDEDVPAADGSRFELEETHERRILSWSPDPRDDWEPEVEEPAEPSQLDREIFQPAKVTVERERPLPPARPPEGLVTPREHRSTPPIESVQLPVEPGAAERPHPAAREHSPARPPDGGEGSRKRGRPRGRPRRQVHFHVDPDEELLLLAAVEAHGSQQKGLVAALQALQDNEILRAEVERLRTECERQRVLLAEAEAIFNR